MAAKLYKRVLLTNDDGIDGDGIKTLERAVSGVAEEVWIVAPERNHSGSSASINLREPLKIKQLGDCRFAVIGTPCDSVITAVRYIMRDAPPDLVLSGVNRGMNLCDDLLFSGTTNAALVALFFGFKSIAFSLAYHDVNELRWSVAEEWVPRILKTLSSAGSA